MEEAILFVPVEQRVLHTILLHYRGERTYVRHLIAWQRIPNCEICGETFEAALFIALWCLFSYFPPISWDFSQFLRQVFTASIHAIATKWEQLCHVSWISRLLIYRVSVVRKNFLLFCRDYLVLPMDSVAHTTHIFYSKTPCIGLLMVWVGYRGWICSTGFFYLWKISLTAGECLCWLFCRQGRVGEHR